MRHPINLREAIAARIVPTGLGSPNSTRGARRSRGGACEWRSRDTGLSALARLPIWRDRSVVTRFETPIRTVAASELGEDDVVALAGPSATERVSLYLSTHPSGREVAQDPVRLRHLIAFAERELVDGRLLTSARALMSEQAFWAHGTDGLAVLVEDGSTTAVRLPEPVPELAVVSDRFHLKPVLRAVAQVVRFDVLALSQHAVRLLRDAGRGVVEIDLPGLANGMPGALRWDDRERQLQSHTAGRAGSGQVTAAFHGQGGISDWRQTDVERYLRAVDEAVIDARRDSSLPLVLAGVDELVASYRRVTRCRHLLDAHISGNPDQLRAEALADRARELVPPVGSRREARAREVFLAGAAATVDTIEQAVIAAAAGQVASIFVPADREHWGRYRPGHHLITEHDERRPGDHDLADVAATETLLHGGAAYVVLSGDIPGGGAAAATLQF